MPNSHAPHRADVDLRRLIPLAIWSALGLISVTLIARSATGAFSRPLPPLILCLIAAAALALSLAAWWWDDRLRVGRRHSVAGVIDPGPRTPITVPGVTDPGPIASTPTAGVTDPGYSTAYADISPCDRSARGVIALLPALAIGITTSGGASAAIGVLLGLGLISAAVVLAVTWELDPRLAFRQPSQPAAGPIVPAQALVSGEIPTSAGPEPDSTFSDPGVSQYITRRTTPDGLDCLEALLRVPFAAGEREAVVHLPLHPPLAGPPEVECEPLDDADLTFKVTTAQTYGVRIEVRRGGEYDEACTFAVGVALHARKAAEAA